MRKSIHLEDKKEGEKYRKEFNGRDTEQKEEAS